MSKKILIVDDSATARQSVRIPLQRYGFQCLEAVDGIDALRKLSERTVDMIITDIHMPNMDGLELVREVRNSIKSQMTPVVMLSVESGDDIKRQAKEAGANGWLAKPFQFGNFVKYINIYLK